MRKRHSNRGTATQTLEELEQCGFIEKYNDYSGRKGRYIYQLIDFFTLFYYRFMRSNKQFPSAYWSKSIGSGSQNAWAGLSFEKLCLVHIDKIQQKLWYFRYSYYCICLEKRNRAKRCADRLVDRQSGQCYQCM